MYVCMMEKDAALCGAPSVGPSGPSAEGVRQSQGQMRNKCPSLSALKGDACYGKQHARSLQRC